MGELWNCDPNYCTCDYGGPLCLSCKRLTDEAKTNDRKRTMTNNEHAKPLDLDALESLLAKATKCEQDWRIDCKEFENANEAMADILRQDIAKLAPALIAELRELREDEALHVEVIGDLMAETTTLKAEIEKLRAALRAGGT